MYLQLFIARRENRLTQNHMADVLGIHRISYHAKESGKTDFTLREAIKLAEYFNRSLDDLFGSLRGEL